MLLQLVEPGSTPLPHDEPVSFAIGIDLGTTNSVVAYSQNHQPVIILNEDGQNLTPSVVAYIEKTSLVGQKALDLIETHPEAVVTSVKRLMGKSQQPESFLGHFEPSEDTTSMLRLKVGSSIKTPIEVSADILRALKHQAELYLENPVTKAVITVPAYFDEGARQATKEAASMAGLQVLRLINEPTAAALAYGLDTGAEGVYAVYDLGGGTFDLSLLRLTKGVFQVLATGGDTHLGGDDIDHLITDLLPATTAPKEQRLLARQIKEHLSTHSSWTQGNLCISSQQIEALSLPLISKTLEICRQVLRDAELIPEDVNGVVLVGGSTRMPLIHRLVGEFFNQEPRIDLDPDAVVALGAAVQAEALTQGLNTLLLDVTPLSLGIELMGGIVEKIIPRNTPIPAAYAQEFTTYQDGQTMMDIHVVQGERECARHCRSLGKITINGIPPLVAGAARVRVTFALDADGLLTVSAEEQTTGHRQHIDIKPSYGLSDEDMSRILREGFEHAAEDIEERLLIEARVDGQQLITQLLTILPVDHILLSAEEKQEIHDKLALAQEALSYANRAALKNAIESLEAATRPLAERRLDRSIADVLTGQKI